MPGRQEFPVSYDRTTKVISAVACAFLLLVVAATRNAVAGCLSGIVVVLAYAYSPRGYTITGRAILVRRLIGSARFPLEDVREARPAAPDDFLGSIRLWGSGGMFGYYGLFRTSKLGSAGGTSPAAATPWW